ncbi:putative C6 transcription factor [Dactylonectria macrodidyma]|uniref:C6 transcription factor n=1 Tax=Dactylonectria macrodidyma TaxID=307937 RepID=A0A9P9EPA9_9HYPO|nr:putative C6 transcription factor [Dactylonectria macrodidyma]
MQGLAPSPRKRRRPFHSCNECRRRKLRCDRKQPCGRCVAQHAPSCDYTSNSHITSDQPASFTPRTEPRALPPTPSASSLPSNDSPHASVPIRGIQSKTRVFGHGHWMSTRPVVFDYSNVKSLAGYGEVIQLDSVSQMMAQCKQLAQDLKSRRPRPRWLPVQIRESFPRASVVEELINLYFTHFESCYRILHYPSFQADYQSYLNQPEEAKSSFLVLLLLVMSAAAILHGDADVRHEMTAKIPSWIHICQGWLGPPLHKDRLTLRGIQISCLLLLVRQVNRIGADIVWISTGSLLRMAMQMGLHQDPSSLKEMDVLQVEIRRRLWYTILEMNVQTALDSGMPPMITDQDWTTQPPSDLSDADLGFEGHPTQWAATMPAASSRALFQRALAQSIALRLEATRVINSLQEEPSYDDVLLLGNKLTGAFRQAVQMIQGDTSTSNSESSDQFALSFSTHLLRRFLLCLHFPYAVKVKRTPTYAHSQKVSLEVAQELLSLLGDERYAKVLINGGGMFRDIITRGFLVIYLELVSELEPSISIFASKRSRDRQMALMEDIRQVLQYSKDRMIHSETSPKAFLFLSVASAQLEALLDGREGDDSMAKAAHESLVTCQEILKAKLDSASSTSLADASPWAVDGMQSPLTSHEFGFDFLGGEELGHGGSYLDLFQAWADGMGANGELW